MRLFYSFVWAWALFFLVTFSVAMGQAAPPAASNSATTDASAVQATLQAFQSEQRALAQERQALVAQGATQAQLTAWFQQNAGRFAAQQQRAEAMGEASDMIPVATNNQANIPANASPTLRDFLNTQSTLANALAQIHNQIIQQMAASSPSLTSAQIDQLQEQAKQAFQQQHAAEFQLQARRAQALAAESRPTVIAVPVPLVMPPNASPQMQALLITRDSLMRSQIAFNNQHLNDDPATRQAATQQWQQQNAALFQQMQQEAQALSQSVSSATN